MPPAELPLWLGPELDRRFGTASRIGYPLPLRREWSVAEGTENYWADVLLDALIDESDDDAAGEAPEWRLAITAADLHAPRRDFVFGVATVGGCCALVSSARLRPEGAGCSPDRFAARVLKEAVHELGHVTGLPHCDHQRCVMHASYDLLETDHKTADFCRRCGPSLRLRLRSAP